uniref:Uncharacterized protein n=1 Tax=Anopheles christyi TaxID=43041 RepID=A0A182KIF3_9DIPT
MLSAASSASWIEYTAADGATFSPISPTRSANSFLSSVSIMDRIGVPMIFTPYRANSPARSISTPQFRAVWPPNVSSTPLGRSALMTRST